MERSNLNPPSHSATGSGQAAQRPNASLRGWKLQRQKLIAILGPAGETRFTDERAVAEFVGRLVEGVPLRASKKLDDLFKKYCEPPQARRPAAAPAKTEREAPAASASKPVAPTTANAAGLKEIFKAQKTFNAKSPAYIAKFVALVARRHIDPTKEDLVAALLPAFQEEVETAIRPAPGGDGSHALMQAVELGEAAQVADLLKAGVNPARKFAGPANPLSREDYRKLANLASNYPRTKTVAIGGKEITRADQFLSEGLLQQIQSSLTDVDRPQYVGRNALTFALVCKAGEAVLATICLWVVEQREAGEPCDLLDKPDGQGCTPLFLAVAAGDRSSVELLIEYGAELDRPCTSPSYGYTPLMEAVAKNDGPMLNLLLEKGADPLAIGADGDSGLSFAIKTKDADVLNLLLAAAPGRLQAMARGMKEEREIAGSSKEAPRFARAAKELDDLMDEAVRVGDKDLQKLVRPCQDMAHRLQVDDPLESLFLRIKIHKQDPTKAPSELLLESLRQAPEEWARRLASAEGSNACLQA